MSYYYPDFISFFYFSIDRNFLEFNCLVCEGKEVETPTTGAEPVALLPIKIKSFTPIIAATKAVVRVNAVLFKT